MKYLFNYWSQIKEKIKFKNFFLFLDYDGTITPIVNTPGEAELSPEVKKLLLQISQNRNSNLAIISGRALKEIRKKVNLKGIIYAGNHGLEIEGKGLKLKGLVGKEYKIILQKLKRILEERLFLFKGIIIEDKGLSLSIHYRLTDKRKIPLIKREIERVMGWLDAKEKIELREGKMVKEIRPKVNWDKGKAVKWILKNNRGKYFPIYIGDDKTDEDAFRIIKRIGLSIYVGKPKKSFADYFLHNFQEVGRFLRELLWLN